MRMDTYIHAHKREVCTFGDCLSSTSFLLWSCAITLPSGSAWPDVSAMQAMLSCLTRSIACCRRKLYEDYKKALTSEFAAKRMKTVNQRARINGVDTKRLRETLSKEMLAYQCAGFHTFHNLRGVFSCTEDGTRMVEPAKEKIANLAARVGTNIAMALPIQVCGSKNTGSQTTVQTSSPHLIFFHVRQPLLIFTNVTPHSLPVLHCNF